MFTIWKKSAPNEGISCVIRNHNDGDWILHSIASIIDFADEIIFVDNGSSDGSLEKVREFKDGLGIEKLKIYTFPPLDGRRYRLHLLYNYAFGLATKSWVFKWDADFVARTHQRFSIMELRELWARGRQWYDVFWLCGYNLFGDHLHYLDSPPTDRAFCYERYLWRNSDYTFVDAGRYERLKLLGRRRAKRIGPGRRRSDHRAYFFHLQGLKPDDRIARRNTLGGWWSFARDSNSDVSYEEWCSGKWGVEDTAAQAEMCMTRMLSKVRRHSEFVGRQGSYPKLLNDYLESPRYEIIYEDGRPTRRITHDDRPIPFPKLET